MPRRHINPNATRLAASGAAAVPRDVVAARTANARRCLELLLSGGPHAQAGWAGLAGVINIAEAFGELGIGRGGDAPRVLREATDTLARIWTHAEERKTWALTLEQRVEVSERCGLLVDLYALQLGSASQSEHERAFNRAKARLESARHGQYGKGVTVVGEM